MSEIKMAPALSGNTKTESAKKRMFQLTLNCEENEDIEISKNILLDRYSKLKDYLTNLKFTYFISCLEQNEKGFYHIHIFIQFDTPHKLSIKKCQGSHIEYCKGSVNDNIKYIKKDHNILDEIGSPKLIIGSARIKDIIKCNDQKELLKLDYKYINCINSIKGPNWYQPLLNCKKNINFINKIDFKNIENNYNDHTYTSINDKNKFINISPNIVIQYNKLIFRLLNHYNIKFQDFHLNDIKNIIILYDNINDYRYFIKFFNENVLNLCDCNIQKITSNDQSPTLNFPRENQNF